MLPYLPKTYILFTTNFRKASLKFSLTHDDYGTLTCPNYYPGKITISTFTIISRNIFILFCYVVVNRLESGEISGVKI